MADCDLRFNLSANGPAAVTGKPGCHQTITVSVSSLDDDHDFDAQTEVWREKMTLRDGSTITIPRDVLELALGKTCRAQLDALDENGKVVNARWVRAKGVEWGPIPTQYGEGSRETLDRDCRSSSPSTTSTSAGPTTTVTQPPSTVASTTSTSVAGPTTTSSTSTAPSSTTTEQATTTASSTTSTSRPPGGELPHTGADSADLLSIGASALLAGAMITAAVKLRARRAA